MGSNGERFVEVDVAGRELRNLVEPVKPVPGNNVRLTIDLRLQTGRAARRWSMKSISGTPISTASNPPAGW